MPPGIYTEDGLVEQYAIMTPVRLPVFSRKSRLFFLVKLWV